MPDPDIAALPETELRDDRNDCLQDITYCVQGLRAGIETILNMSVVERICINAMMVEKIDGELKRRGLPIVT